MCEHVHYARRCHALLCPVKRAPLRPLQTLPRVAAPITATLFGKVNFLTPHYLENYDDRQQKLIGFELGAPPHVQIC